MLIGISGKAQAGKDTTYDMIVYTIWYHNIFLPLIEKFKLEFNSDDLFSFENFKKFTEKDLKLYSTQYIEKKSFANKLKECLSIILDCNRDDFEDINFKNEKIEWLDNITVRELLQKFGTAIRNEVDPNFWIKLCLENYEEKCNWIIPDVRFLSEIKAIEEKNGMVIRIERENSGANNHISEIELDNYEFKYVINNNGTLEDLLFKVKDFCDYYKLI